MSRISAVVLAAGVGTRLQCENTNKVMLSVGGKPMIERSIEVLEKAKFSPVVVVVGFAKEGIMRHFGERVVFAEQKKRLGTAHAVSVALKKVPKSAPNVLVVNGDDSYNYPTSLLIKLINKHIKSKADITLLTIEKDNPKGLGRIIRKSDGEIIGVVEEKDATDKQREITEVNPQCWVFKTEFLGRYLPRVTKSPVTGEYYLTELIKLAVLDNKHIEAVKGGKLAWRGVNTRQELEEAELIIRKGRLRPDGL